MNAFGRPRWTSPTNTGGSSFANMNYFTITTVVTNCLVCPHRRYTPSGEGFCFLRLSNEAEALHKFIQNKVKLTPTCSMWAEVDWLSDDSTGYRHFGTPAPIPLKQSARPSSGPCESNPAPGVTPCAMATPTCTECGGRVFSLTIAQEIEVMFEPGDHEVHGGPDGDLTWDDNTPSVCTKCGHRDLLGKMKSTATVAG